MIPDPPGAAADWQVGMAQEPRLPGRAGLFAPVWCGRLRRVPALTKIAWGGVPLFFWCVGAWSFHSPSHSRPIRDKSKQPVVRGPTGWRETSGRVGGGVDMDSVSPAGACAAGRGRGDGMPGTFGPGRLALSPGHCNAADPGRVPVVSLARDLGQNVTIGNVLDSSGCAIRTIFGARYGYIPPAIRGRMKQRADGGAARGILGARGMVAARPGRRTVGRGCCCDRDVHAGRAAHATWGWVSPGTRALRVGCPAAFPRNLALLSCRVRLGPVAERGDTDRCAGPGRTARGAVPPVVRADRMFHVKHPGSGRGAPGGSGAGCFT